MIFKRNLSRGKISGFSNLLIFTSVQFLLLCDTRHSSGCMIKNPLQTAIQKMNLFIESSWFPQAPLPWCQLVDRMVKNPEWNLVKCNENDELNGCPARGKLEFESGSDSKSKSKLVAQHELKLSLYCQLPTLEHIRNVTPDFRLRQLHDDQNVEKTTTKPITELVFNCSQNGQNRNKLDFQFQFGLDQSFFKHSIFKLLNLNNLEQVVIENCGVSSIHPNAFTFAPNLEALVLPRNQLENFPVLEKLPKLKMLDLSFNAMTHVNPVVLNNRLEALQLQSTSKLQVLFEGNPWNCNCSMEWLFHYFVQANETNWKIKEDDPKPVPNPNSTLFKNRDKDKDGERKRISRAPFTQLVIVDIERLTCRLPNLKRRYFTAAYNEYMTLTEVFKYTNGIMVSDYKIPNYYPLNDEPSGQFSQVPLTDAPLDKFLCPYQNFNGNDPITFNLNADADAKETWFWVSKCPLNCHCFHSDKGSLNIVDCSAIDIPEFGIWNHDHFEIPRKVTILDLGGNPWLQHGHPQLHLGDQLKKLNRLQKLHLNDCEFTVSPRLLFPGTGAGNAHGNGSTFENELKLEQLYLQNNNIRHLRGDEFQTLVFLQVLFLRDNLLETIAPQTFRYLSELKILDLRDNRLKSLVEIPPLLTGTKLGLKNIRLSHNPWICDCQVIPLINNWSRYDNNDNKNQKRNMLEHFDPPPCNYDARKFGYYQFYRIYCPDFITKIKL